MVDLFSPLTGIDISISAATMRQLFHPCTKDFISNICHAKCCESSVAPSGTLITIHASEQKAIETLGGCVDKSGFLQPRSGERRCPFKTTNDLCGLHGTTNKPFGCVASPFTLSRRGCLIVRNRYRLLKCFKAEGAIPVYKAHSGSLFAIFGNIEGQRLVTHFDNGGGDTSAKINVNTYNMLKDNDVAKKVVGNDKAMETENGD